VCSVESRGTLVRNILPLSSGKFNKLVANRSPYFLLKSLNTAMNSPIGEQYIRFKIRIALVMKNIFWDINPCSPLKVNRRF
jgi:hypothetical protein